MAYQREIFDKAAARLEQLRQQAHYRRAQRLKEAYAACPGLAQIDEELSRAGIAASRIILSQPGDQKKVVEQLAEQIKTLTGLRAEALTKCDLPADYTDMRFACPLCSDTGYIENKRCACLEKLLADAYARTSGLGSLLSGQTFESFDFSFYSAGADENEGVCPLERIKNIYAICKSFVDDFDACGQSLLFTGGAGLGKTFLSSAIAAELIKCGHTVVYESAARLFSLYLDYSFGRISPEAARPYLGSLHSCDLLIIDDLGTEAVSAYSVSFLFELLNSRLLDKKKMIISTNLSIGELAGLYSERLHSRMLEHFVILKFLGCDIRMQKMAGSA
ncbi:MAG: DNA replication protein DnaC [Firmicutes bacterium ADurb.Bin193]|nr:MAG: DNA replication protein DnaC [Firmicutes bacterium ADurb.Bin193]